MYTSFFADFGPLDLGVTCKFCQQLHDLLSQAQQQLKAVIYFAGVHEQKRANNAVLLLAYLVSYMMNSNLWMKSLIDCEKVFVLNYTVEQAYGPFIGDLFVSNPIIRLFLIVYLVLLKVCLLHLLHFAMLGFVSILSLSLYWILLKQCIRLYH